MCLCLSMFMFIFVYQCISFSIHGKYIFPPPYSIQIQRLDTICTALLTSTLEPVRTHEFNI